MKFNFKKVSSILASAAMLGSTIGIAAAAAYPAPFVSGSTSDVAIVVGTTGAQTDFTAATDIGTNLNTALSGQAASGGAVTITGETYPLFTSSSKLYLNSTLNANRETVTASNLPIVLKDGSFEGDVSTTYEQRITVGSNPVVAYAKQPTNDDDPVAGLKIGTSANTQYVYNATVIFGTPINFTHADTKGQDLNLFGSTFTVGSATTTTKLILFKSSKKLYLDSTSNPSETTEIAGATYTVDLVAASDTSATIKVTDSTGKSEQKEVNEAASKKINGVEVAVNTADESTALNKNSAEVVVGASRITFQNGNSVKTGSDDDLIDGTNVVMQDSSSGATAYPGNVSRIIVQVSADSSDEDAITPGHEFVDPVFGSFKVTFPGLNIADDSTTDRETIEVKNSAGDKMTVKFQSHEASEAQSVEYAYNKTTSQNGIMDLADSDGDPIIVAEMALVNKSQYVVLPNTDEGGLYEVTQIGNSSSTTASDDELIVKNVMTGTEIKAKATTEGSGTFTAQGKSVTYTYTGASTVSNEARQARFNFQESSGNDAILYPSIKTKKGAKLILYEPLNISITNWNGAVGASNITNFRFENGNGYTAVALTNAGGNTNWTINAVEINTSSAAGINSTTVAIGKLTYNFSSSGTSQVLQVRLMNPQGTVAPIATPAIVILSEKDNSNNYEGNIVTLDAGYDGSSAGLGVSDVVRTWELDASTNLGNEIQLESNSDIYKDIDWFGVITTLDKSDSDQTTATISYPDDQVYAQVYIAEVGASLSTGGGSTTGNIVPVYDNEAAKISGKNLVVVGGSCVNTVAAELLGATGKLCGADFTAKTAIGDGEYLIETFSRTGGKVATLVAGYNAADTSNAAKSLVKNKPEITVGKKFKGTTADTLTAA